MDDQIRAAYKTYGNMLTSIIKPMLLSIGFSMGEIKCVVLEGLWDALKTFDPNRGVLDAHVVCVTMNTAKSEYSAYWRKKHTPVTTATSLDTPLIKQGDRRAKRRYFIVDNVDLFDEIWAKECIKAIHKSLSPFELAVALQHDGTYEQTANLIGCTPKSVDNALQRVRKKIKECTA